MIPLYLSRIKLNAPKAHTFLEVRTGPLPKGSTSSLTLLACTGPAGPMGHARSHRVHVLRFRDVPPRLGNAHHGRIRCRHGASSPFRFVRLSLKSSTLTLLSCLQDLTGASTPAICILMYAPSLLKQAQVFSPC